MSNTYMVTKITQMVVEADDREHAREVAESGFQDSDVDIHVEEILGAEEVKGQV